MSATYLILLADRKTLFHHLGDRFRPETATVELGHLMILAIVILLFFVAIWFLQRFEWAASDHPFRDERGMFNDLCQLHELNEVQITLLTRVVQQNCGDQWSRVFVDPSLLQMEAAQASNENAQVLADLGSRFFGYHLFEQTTGGGGASTSG
ncbi:MAG: hypothetical protein WDZ51_09260 [Pirellulaceae bacterium]